MGQDECEMVYAELDNFKRVSVLAEALPYLQRFAGQTVVVKYGGAAMKDERLKDSVIRDLVLLSTVGRRREGGPPQTDATTRVTPERSERAGRCSSATIQSSIDAFVCVAFSVTVLTM